MNETAALRPVGILYTTISAVAVYSTTTDPNWTESLSLCACTGFAVGVTVHATLDVLVPIDVCVVGDTESTDATVCVTSPTCVVVARPIVACFAPTGRSAPVPELSTSVHVSVASRPSVTVLPPDAPLLFTTHVAESGNTYIALWETVALTVVFVSLNVNVNVVSLAGAVTVAPSFFVPVVTEVPNAASSATSGPDGDCCDSARTPIEPALSDARSTLAFVFENVKLVSVSRSATSEYPSSIVATLTAFGTAYTVRGDSGGVFSSSSCPAGDPTFTPNRTAPVFVPTPSSVTTIVTIVPAVTVYVAVYVAVPMYAFTAPVDAMTVLASVSLRLSTMAPVAPAAVPYTVPAASPVTCVPFVVTVAASAVGHANTVPDPTSVSVYVRVTPDHVTLSVAVVAWLD